MKRENKILLYTCNFGNYFYMRKALGLLSFFLLFYSFSAFTQCKFKETIIPGTGLKMKASNDIRLTNEVKDYSYKFIKIDSSYFVSSNTIKRAVDKQVFSINDSCAFVFLLDTKLKVILYPVNPLNVEHEISDYLFGKQGSGNIYYSITPFQLEQITTAFYTNAQLYFKSDKQPEGSATDIWGSYFTFETKKSIQIKQFLKIKCLLTQ
jgi:hypothetical protein